MANVSLVSVVFYGEEQKIKRLERDLRRSCTRRNRKKPPYEVDYDWIGNIFIDHREIIGCNKNIYSIPIRDSLACISRDVDKLYLELNARWESNFNIYRILANHYNVKFEASQEEWNDDIYVNTDLTCDYLPDRYIIKYIGEDEDIDSHYCSDKTEVEEFLNKQNNKNKWEVHEYESSYEIKDPSREVIGRRRKRRKARLRKKRRIRCK